MTAAAPPVADPAPLLAALRSYGEDGLVPFSRPGHKRDQEAAGELRALLGDGVFDRDGDEVVVGRDLHKSLLVGLILHQRGPLAGGGVGVGQRRQLLRTALYQLHDVTRAWAYRDADGLGRSTAASPQLVRASVVG